MRSLLLALVFGLVTLESLGQSTNIGTFFQSNRSKADLLFSQKAWRNALVIYQHMVDKNESDVYAKQQIAECYVKMNDLFSAQTWYQALMREPNVSEETKFKYAQVLYITQRYSEAIELLKSINKKKVDSLLVEKQLYFLKHIDNYKHDTAFTVMEAKPINTPHSDFGATYYKGDVVFASTRDYDLFVKRKSMSAPTPEESLAHLYWTDYQRDHTGDSPGSYGEVKIFKGETLKSYHHDGPIAFFDQGRKAAITSNNLQGQKLVVGNDGLTHLKLYTAEIGALGELRNINPFPYNSDDYSVAQATFTKNSNRIYFAANYPKGYGGSDIYYCDWINNEWSVMINAGPAINTAGDENFPYLENDSTLFFTSNGHGGFGGLDVYTAKMRHGKFAFVRNLGTPINSPYDDFAMVMDSTGRQGFFTSNRFNGTGSDDIYWLRANYIFLQGFTRDLDSLSRVIPGTTLVLRDEKGNIIDTAISDDQGMFEIKLPFDQDLTLSASKKGYTGIGDVGLSTKGLAFNIDSMMVPLRKQRDVFAKGKIYSNETHKTIPDVKVTLTNITESTTSTYNIGEKGLYTLPLLSDHKYKIEASKDGYITNGFELNTENIKRDTVLYDIVLEETYVDKVTIHFDYAKNTIRADSKVELDKIIRNMKKFPETTIQISAHADSRGPAAYNQTLSDSRAKASLDYIVSKGISKNRIEARGFGETLILNRCVDGVTCTEEEHSLNRRAEVKVQKKD